MIDRSFFAGHARPGRGIPARAILGLAGQASALSRTLPGPGFEGTDTPSGLQWRRPCKDSYFARLAGSNNPYTFEEVVGGPNGSWVVPAQARTGNRAYDLNLTNGLDGKVVEITPVASGAWHRFEYKSLGRRGIWCCDVLIQCGQYISILHGATITVTDSSGATVTPYATYEFGSGGEYEYCYHPIDCGTFHFTVPDRYVAPPSQTICPLPEPNRRGYGFFANVAPGYIQCCSCGPIKPTLILSSSNAVCNCHAYPSDTLTYAAECPFPVTPGNFGANQPAWYGSTIFQMDCEVPAYLDPYGACSGAQFYYIVRCLGTGLSLNKVVTSGPFAGMLVASGPYELGFAPCLGVLSNVPLFYDSRDYCTEIAGHTGSCGADPYFTLTLSEG